MKKAGNEIVRQVIDWLQADERWEYDEKCLDFPLQRTSYSRFRVTPDGRVYVFCLGQIPLDWTQRRSIRRAYAKAHKRMTDKLIEAGKRAMAALKA